MSHNIRGVRGCRWHFRQREYAEVRQWDVLEFLVAHHGSLLATEEQWPGTGLARCLGIMGRG